MFHCKPGRFSNADPRPILPPYALGGLSSWRAAELASMSRGEFLLSLERYHVCPLSAELEDLEQSLA